MAFVGPAAADSVTSPTGTTYTSTIKASAEGHVTGDNPINPVSCASTLEGKVESHGAGKPVSGKLSSVTFTGCTDEWQATVVAGGSISINGTTGSYNGDVFWTGATIDFKRFGINCRYATNNTTIGTLTGGTPATIDISGGLPFHNGSIFCGTNPMTWTGSYTISTPGSLFVDKN